MTHTRPPARNAVIDDLLMQQVQEGDPSAHAALVERWGHRSHRYLHRRTGEPTAAAAAFHRTWAQVWWQRATHQPGDDFEAWLFHIASRVPVRPPDPQPESFGWTPAEGRDAVADRDTLLRRLYSLVPVDREVVLLTAEGRHPDEIEAALGLPAGAATARLRAAGRRVLPRAMRTGEPDPRLLSRWINRLCSAAPEQARIAPPAAVGTTARWVPPLPAPGAPGPDAGPTARTQAEPDDEPALSPAAPWLALTGAAAVLLIGAQLVITG